MLPKFITFALLLSSCAADDLYKDLNTAFEWKSVEFEFPSDNDRQYAIDNGLYTPNAGVPIDVAVEYKPNGKVRIFQTIPRFTDGIPFTLATLTKRSTQNGPVIEAYPNYAWHNVNNAGCEGITSAFRVAIDECQHMWVIDSGIANDVQICPPQLLVFDLTTDILIHRYQYPSHVYTPSESLLVTIAVNIHDLPPKGACRSATVYVADIDQPGLVVYSSDRNQAWRIEDELMFPRAPWGHHTIAGQTFELMDGIFSLNLSPRKEHHRYLFFHAYADDRECAVPLHYIDHLHRANKQKPNQFQVLGSRGVQAAMEAIDSKGNIFANTNDPVSIFVWNINTPYNNQSIRVVANNPEQLQFASGMKVVRSPQRQEQLWVSTCKLQKVMTDTLDYTQVNFRVMFCLTEDLLKNGRCKDTQNVNWTDLLYEGSAPNQRWPGRGSHRHRG